MRCSGTPCLLLDSEPVHSDNDRLQSIHALLVFVSRVLDLLLHKAAFDRLQHAAQGIDFL